MTPIPSEIRGLNGVAIPIHQRALPAGKLGYWDSVQGEIVVSSEIPEPAKWEILLHELLHAIDDTISRPLWLRVVAPRLPHFWIEQGAAFLFELLVMSGALAITADEAEPWLRSVRGRK